MVKTVWYIQRFDFDWKTLQKSRSVGNHPHHPTPSFGHLHMTLFGSESFIKKTTTANLRKLNVSLLMLHRHSQLDQPSSWSQTAELSPPYSAWPQVTTDPSSSIAAKAESVAWICWTPLSWSRTAELSPPYSAWPQVYTDPSSSIAAKAESVAWICWTPLSWSRTAELSPPYSAWP